MLLNIIAVGTKLPSWATSGFLEYAKRMSSDPKLKLTEIPTAKRSKNNTAKICQDIEGKQILSVIKPSDHTIALEVNGKPWSTEQLASELLKWQGLSKNINFLIGGPDGLSQNCRDIANQTWSLSNLTLPHPLARVLVAEQLYRANCININHPYHK